MPYKVLIATVDTKLSNFINTLLNDKKYELVFSNPNHGFKYTVKSDITHIIYGESDQSYLPPEHIHNDFLDTDKPIFYVGKGMTDYSITHKSLNFEISGNYVITEPPRGNKNYTMKNGKITQYNEGRNFFCCSIGEPNFKQLLTEFLATN